jgi:sulfur-carrier protein adenylyltransferase/sulfurtransferase
MNNNAWYLRQDFKYTISKNVLIIVCDNVLNITGDVDLYFKILNEFSLGVNQKRYNEIFRMDNEFVNYIQEQGYLYSIDHDYKLPDYCNRTIHYLSTHTDFPYQALQKMRNASVLFLGVGGTGGAILQHLVSAGLENYILVDNATVNIEDLNRQFLYKVQDLDKKKVEVAKKYIQDFNSSFNVDLYDSYISDVDSLEKIINRREISLIVNAFDTPHNIENIISEFSQRYSIPIFFANCGINDAQAGPLLIPGVTCCPQCYFDSLNSNRSDSEKFARSLCNEPPKASCGPTNSIVSSIAALEITHFLYDLNVESPAKMKYITFNPFCSETINIDTNCKCW